MFESEITVTLFIKEDIFSQLAARLLEIINLQLYPLIEQNF